MRKSCWAISISNYECATKSKLRTVSLLFLTVTQQHFGANDWEKDENTLIDARTHSMQLTIHVAVDCSQIEPCVRFFNENSFKKYFRSVQKIFDLLNTLAHFSKHRLVQCVRLYHVIFTSCSMNNVIQMQKLKYSHFSRKAPNQYRINIKENHRSIFVYNFVEIFKGILFVEISSFRLILLNSWTKIQVFALTALLKMSLVENVRALE